MRTGRPWPQSSGARRRPGRARREAWGGGDHQGEHGLRDRGAGGALSGRPLPGVRCVLQVAACALPRVTAARRGGASAHSHGEGKRAVAARTVCCATRERPKRARQVMAECWGPALGRPPPARTEARRAGGSGVRGGAGRNATLCRPLAVAVQAAGGLATGGASQRHSRLDAGQVMSAADAEVDRLERLRADQRTLEASREVRPAAVPRARVVAQCLASLPAKRARASPHPRPVRPRATSPGVVVAGVGWRPSWAGPSVRRAHGAPRAGSDPRV